MKDAALVCFGTKSFFKLAAVAAALIPVCQLNNDDGAEWSISGSLFIFRGLLFAKCSTTASWHALGGPAVPFTSSSATLPGLAC